MIKRPTTSSYKILGFALKLLIVIGAFSFIYNQIFNKEDISEIKVFAEAMVDEPSDYLLLLLVCLLMLINWSLESVKWQFLIKKIENISFIVSLKAIFAGTCVSIFTPNRIGEFGGRIFYLKTADRIQAIIITIIGSMGQLLITVLLGSVCLLFYLSNYYDQELNNYWLYTIAFIVMALMFLSVAVFLNASILTPLLNRMIGASVNGKRQKLMHRWTKYIEVFSFYSSSDLTRLLAICFIRYLVFTIQYYLLLVIFGVEVPIVEGLMMIVLSFFVMAAVPTVALTELGVRGSVAIYFIGLLSDNNLGITAASFSLWFINLVIPALVGALFVFGLTFFRINQKKAIKNSS